MGAKGKKQGRRVEIVGEELIRLKPGEEADLYEVLSCGHRQRGRYNRDGLPCDVTRTPVRTRICTQCRDQRPTGPPGEVVQP